jgi:CBS domain containing-hemolysin-like protein
MSISGELILFVISMTFAALFAFLETAFTALRLFKLKELEASVAKYKTLFESWEKNPQRILITILIANNFAHVVTSVLISHIMQRFLGSLGLAVGVAVATVAILIFGEIIPKSFAKAHHERLFGSCLWMVNGLFKALYPFVTVLLRIADIFFARVGGQHVLDKQDVISEKEIEFLIDYSDEKGLMETEKTEMLQNIFGLGQTQVREIMIPKNNVVLLNVRASFQEAMDILSSSRFSRVPVFEDKDDNIIGILHQKDLFELLSKKIDTSSLVALVRPIIFVPETKRVNQLLSEFLKKRMHMACIVDEYGCLSGIVTLEDILEEIVGDIADEHEKINSLIVPLDQGGWLVDASIELEDVEDLLQIKFDVEDSLTLGGFLAERLQHLPKKGERLLYESYYFQVQQANSRKVFQVLIFQNQEPILPDGASYPLNDD